MLYLTSKALHIVAIISWMAGVLYLYRLFIYHLEWGQKSSDNHEMLSVMERKLLYYITHPAMGLSWIAGLAMIMQNPLLMKMGWFHAKLGLVVLLTAFTVFGGRLHRKLRNRETLTFTSKQLRFLNEFPTLLMIGIIIFVIFRPF